MATKVKADVCIIGAGSGGLSVAAAAAQLGLDTVLIERGQMGGDCLNTGCVPSKALLAAARRARQQRRADIEGIAAQEPRIDFAGVKAHVARTIEAIAPHDSQERFESLGVRVMREQAAFRSPTLVAAGDSVVEARHFVIAAGSRPRIPGIPGLEREKVFTNETIFGLREQPEHLLIIGGGPIGVEMAQAHRRLGCRVSLFSRGEILPRDDRGNVEVVRHALREEGIELYEQVAIESVNHGAGETRLRIRERSGRQDEVAGSHLLAAAGRQPNTEGLGLDEAGVRHDEKSIAVDSRLRTSNRRIFAVGDIAGGPLFTHVAGYHAGIVIRNICFKLPARVDYRSLPWVTYCDPELAQAGLTEDSARQRYGDRIRVAEWRFADNDRARAERETEGQVRAVTDRGGRILGASIVGAHAGELIGLWALAISKRLKIKAVANMIAPYPTLGEASKRAAGAWYTPALFSPRTRRLVRWLHRLPW